MTRVDRIALYAVNTESSRIVFKYDYYYYYYYNVVTKSVRAQKQRDNIRGKRVGGRAHPLFMTRGRLVSMSHGRLRHARAQIHIALDD